VETVLAAATILGGIAAIWFFGTRRRVLQEMDVSSSARASTIGKVVDFRYPTDSGLQQRLEAERYDVAWCFDSKQ
jgi:hypothetical protein